MHCSTINECFHEINAYCTSKPWGYPFLVNVENYNDFQLILQRLEADTSKQCIFVSQFIQKNGLPIVEDAIDRIVGPGSYALIGVSQSLMLKNGAALDAMIDNLLGLSISGHAVVLLSHCRKFIERYLQRDPRFDRRVVMVDGDASPLPQIKLASDAAVCVGFKPLDGIKGLLGYMERMGDDKIQTHSALTVLTNFNPSLFFESMYSVTESLGAYDTICQGYSDLRLAEEKNGTQEQWKWLLTSMQKNDTFSSYLCDCFGSTTNLVAHLADTIESGDQNKLWVLWLGMKVFGVGPNQYLSRILANQKSFEAFEDSIYNELLSIRYDDPIFATCYAERKRLVNNLPEDMPRINTYCDQIGIYEKNAVWYLTSASEREEYELAKCLSIYNYSKEELRAILRHGFPELERYFTVFTFDAVNTKLPESDIAFRSELTFYFEQYKMQKLTNRIYPDFLETVNSQAQSRPFMKLQPRSSIVSKVEKAKAGVFFFDALGVEYLAFIQAKCENYGLISEVSVGRCELPSITSTNKEFEITCSNVKKISELDELKHHSVNYDYTVCPYPIHIFRELEIIDVELRRIASQLSQGLMEKAIILSDHGASRLAVLYGKESKSGIELEEKGVHSGRCCKIDADPHLPQASYEDGYAVLANYERFKGGRAANLEVHGGATLEEVLVPVIILSKKPESVTYCFVDPVIKFKMGEPAKITLFSNAPMEKPRIQVNGVFYDGNFVGDKKHAEFVMPELKRTNSYDAVVYSGEKNLGVTLKFSIERATKQKNLFGL